MGLPEVKFEFISATQNFVQRSTQGVVALILRDIAVANDYVEYTSLSDVVATEWSATNYKYIGYAFAENPSKVIIAVGNSTDTDYSAELGVLAGKDFNFLAVPGINTTNAQTVAQWIKDQRDDNDKTYQAVLPKTDSDDYNIINFTSEGMTNTDGNTVNATDYTPYLAGLFAAIPQTMSATYYPVKGIASVPYLSKTDANTRIANGELVFYNNGRNVVIGSAVNSLTTLTGKNKQWQKIKIISGRNQMQSDITNIVNDNYTGRYVNSYDNQLQLIATINSAYINGLEGSVLDPGYDNRIMIDVTAKRQGMAEEGISVSGMTDQQILEYVFENNVYLYGDVKFIDAMENFYFRVTV